MSSPGTILVLGDDLGMCQTIGDVLEHRGYTVQIATASRAGLGLPRTSPADVAIVDISLLDMAGADLLAAIRRMRPMTEVIFITRNASLARAIEAINGLAFAFLTKPFEMSQLVGIVDQALEKHQLVQALRQSEERYRLVTEHIADGVFLFDLDGRLELANRSAEHITGYSQEELRGRSILTLLTRDGLESAQARLEDVRGGQEMPPFVELEHVRKDGRRILVEMHVASVMKNGLPVGRLAVARDITERRRLEDDLRQAQKMDGIGRLAGGIAHDFNNLLTAIGGRCYLVLHGLAPNNALRRDWEIVQDATERAGRLTHQLLAFSRKQILEPRVLDLNTTVADIEPLVQRLIGEDIAVTMTLGSGLGNVKADPGQLEQVIINLAVNARDAMLQGGGLTLETTNVTLDEAYARLHAGVEAGRYVMLAVSDTGHGMDASTQARIFEPFFTTKEVGKGTGLGLATVYGIVKQSNGHIAVESAPDQGATFKVYLPIVDALPTTDAPVQGSGATPRGSETLLLVEDDVALRTLAREILQVLGYTVLEAGAPVDALRIAAAHQTAIHLLLTDVVMPQMNGKPLAARLLSGRPALKVLFMSGYTDSAIVEHGVEPGIHLLRKPFTPAGLGSKVRQALDS